MKFQNLFHRNVSSFYIAKNRHLRILSKMAVFCFVSEHNLDGKAAAKKVGVRPIHIWWRQRGSNPRPHGCEPCALTG